MKKSFKVLAVAAIASLTIVACNNNNTEATDTIDSTAIEQVAEEEIIAEPAEVLDTTPVVEEQKTPAAAAKKAVKEVKKEATKKIVTATEDATKDVKEEVKKMEDPNQAAANALKRRRR